MLLEDTGEKLSISNMQNATLQTILQPHVLCYLKIHVHERNRLEPMCKKINLPLLRNIATLCVMSHEHTGEKPYRNRI